MSGQRRRCFSEDSFCRRVRGCHLTQSHGESTISPAPEGIRNKQRGLYVNFFHRPLWHDH
jgi:hypothetical protein